VLFYGETLADDVATAEGRRAVQAELAHALMDGPGIVRLHARRSTRRSWTGPRR
jgi:hypothetical protein